jgi:hypothetical protein
LASNRPFENLCGWDQEWSRWYEWIHKW